MKAVSLNDDESGMALITTMMVLMLASALMVGFFATIMADQRANGIDRDQSQAYAAAHAGLEKLTSDLATKFETDFAPTATEIGALSTYPPVIPGFQYTAPGGTAGSGYLITFPTNAQGNPAPQDPLGSTISTGPYAGFKGIITQYTITSTARSAGGAEVRLRRLLETVSVPVFQFGVFSETDLSFYGGSNFNFGGRVQTNGSLFLSQLGGTTLTMSDRVTAFKEVVRNNLSNGLTVGSVGFTGTVNVPTTIGPPAIYRALGTAEGSVVAMPGSAPTTTPATWTSISTGTYKSNIRSGLTGAKKLSLPLVAFGAQPIDLIRRPVVNEDTGSPLVYGQRYFTMAALRIMLSDTAADITSLPSVTVTAPVPLDGSATAAQYGPVDATHPPFATSPGPQTMTTNGSTAANAGTAGTINVSPVVPAFFRPQLIKVNGNPAAGVVCAGRDATHFLGCAAGLPIALAGATVTSTTNSGAGTIAVSTTLTAAIILNAASLPVVSTGAFAPGVFFVNGLPVTCTGNVVAQTQLTGCAGNTAVIPANSTITTNALSNAGTSLLGVGDGTVPAVKGFIKIELQNAAGNFVDVTTEILNLGFAAPNQLHAPGVAEVLCADPTPNAVIRLQRLRDNANGNCYYPSSLNSNDYWPNALYDTREGNYRDPAADPTDHTLALGGIMNYVALDVNNLKRWLAGTIPAAGSSGPNAVNQNGFIVYFSDRRNNRCSGVPACNNAAAPGVETGEYGAEDVVNPADANGVHNGLLDGGEDFNGNGTLERYGENPPALDLPAGAALPLNNTARPWITDTSQGVGLANRTVLFRRALKLIHGGIGDGGVAGATTLPAPGLSVASENPVYVQGNFNATSTNPAADPHLAASILADSITVLSRNWNDSWSFSSPNDRAGRPALETSYRFAVVAGKGLSFTYPVAGSPMFLFGTDGGLGNFLRYLEEWSPGGGGQTVHYRGSIVILFNSRQAIGTYKCCQRVYDYTVRDYNFDTDFLTPSLLPPGTPMFRDVDTLTFRQLLRPNQ